jgi:hypothetical protein
MITANNGILIVALFFGLGVHLNDNVLMAMAFALAGVSYLVNIARDFDANDLADNLFWAIFAAGAGGYLYAAARLSGYV